MTTPRRLTPNELYHSCDPNQFSFKTTAELQDLKEAVGQTRALAAIKFGMGIQQPGYNMFALGPSGTGKHTSVSKLLEARAAQDPSPSDWCYVNNFDQPHKPNVIRLPCGYGSRLARAMERLVDELRHAVPTAFESDEYRAQAQEIEQEFKDRQERALDEVKAEAGKKEIALIRTPGGFAFAPIKDGEVLSPAEYEKLPKEEQRRLEGEIERLQKRLRDVIRQVPQWRSQTREKLKNLNREVVAAAVGYLIENLKKEYLSLPQVLNYLDRVEKDVVDNVDEFRGDDEGNAAVLQLASGRSTPFQRYQVNVLVDNGETKGAPVIYEDHPTYLNLVGRVEHAAMMGTLVTDFRLIKPGALHRANDGYLVLDAFKILQHPYAWEGLKRALRSEEARIQSLEQMLSLVSTVSLEPECIPLNVKVVLLGDRILYYLLYQLDPEFPELFKVAADFEDSVDRTQETTQFYARLIATLARKHVLRPFSASAVSRIIEQCSRLVGDAGKLSAHMRSISDLLCEADYWAGENGHSNIDASDVQQAIDGRETRSGRLRERHLEAIMRGTILIDTEGERVGAINGLSVVGVGDVEFGVPARITAVVRLGEGDVVDIEREVELGGPIHSKGVFILSSFLGSRYSPEQPLSLSASLVFEQSYGEIEGDSASSTELYALLSALAELPIKQTIAVTGSVNQHGEIQAIGGVNQKIEGFFDLCRANGLTGEHGVIIPASNVEHLMLRHDVVNAAAAGKFHIYPVRTVDQGIAILTGLEAGGRDHKGKYPENSINFKVETRLARMAETRHEFTMQQKESKEGDGEEEES